MASVTAATTTLTRAAAGASRLATDRSAASTGRIALPRRAAAGGAAIAAALSRFESIARDVDDGFPRPRAEFSRQLTAVADRCLFVPGDSEALGRRKRSLLGRVGQLRRRLSPDPKRPSEQLQRIVAYWQRRRWRPIDEELALLQGVSEALRAFRGPAPDFERHARVVALLQLAAVRAPSLSWPSGLRARALDDLIELSTHGMVSLSEAARAAAASLVPPYVVATPDTARALLAERRERQVFVVARRAAEHRPPEFEVHFRDARGRLGCWPIEESITAHGSGSYRLADPDGANVGYLSLDDFVASELCRNLGMQHLARAFNRSCHMASAEGQDITTMGLIDAQGTYRAISATVVRGGFGAGRWGLHADGRRIFIKDLPSDPDPVAVGAAVPRPSDGPSPVSPARAAIQHEVDVMRQAATALQVGAQIELPGRVCLEFEAMAGTTAQLAKSGAIPLGSPMRVAMCRSVAAQAAQELADFHDKGFVHWDVKPRNFLYQTDGHVRLSDFGLATTGGLGPEAGRRGTHVFMAPEWFHATPRDAAADLWSLGATLCYLLARTSRHNGFLAAAESSHALRAVHHTFAAWHARRAAAAADLDAAAAADLDAASDAGWQHFYEDVRGVDSELADYTFDHLLVPDPARRHTAAEAAEALLSLTLAHRSCDVLARQAMRRIDAHDNGRREAIYGELQRRRLLDTGLDAVQISPGVSSRPDDHGSASLASATPRRMFGLRIASSRFPRA